MAPLTSKITVLACFLDCVREYTRQEPQREQVKIKIFRDDLAVTEYQPQKPLIADQ